MKRTLIILIALFAAIISWADQPFCILHINDLHSHLEPMENEEGTQSGGIARIATLVGDIKAQNEIENIPTYFLLAGDMISGTPYSTVFAGEATIATLNSVGVDAMTIGNHEFDFGQENLFSLIEQAEFPVFSANISKGDEFEQMIITDGYVILGEQPGVLVIGLTTPETVYTTHPKNVADIYFNNPAERTNSLLKHRTGNYDIVIGLTHLGVDVDKKLAEGVPGLDIIVGGHSHTLLEQPEYSNDTPIVQVGAYGYYVGRLDAVYTDAGTVEISNYELLPVTEKLENNPETEAILSEYRERLGDEMSEIVADIPTQIIAEASREAETTFGDILTDVIRNIAGTDIAFSNAGGIRANLGPGKMSIGDVLTALPFNNTIETASVSGEQLQAIFDFCAREQTPGGGFLQVSGMTVKTIPGENATDIVVGGEPIEPEKE